MSANPAPRPCGDQWKDIGYVLEWRKGRQKDLEEKWRKNFPALLSGISLAAEPGRKLPPAAVQLVQWESESLLHRANRLESAASGQKQNASIKNSRSKHQVPDLLARDGAGWIVAPAAQRASAGKLEKAKAMYKSGLEKKAQRELACGVIGGEVSCKTGHSFRVSYECGNRYCVTCGPRGAVRLFAKHADKLLFVTTRLMLCGAEDCAECSKAIEEKRAPHWPPAPGVRPKMVVAKLDFTLRNTGERPGPEMMRELNTYIKRFCRAIERRFKIRRKDYGLAYCDELGGNNSNAHAHGIYVGPWLPQDKEKKQLSQLWNEITGGSFILSIKYARNFSEALFHAIKYPAKFAERSTPKRLAELERIFHKVRRFHTLAAFYAPEAPESEKPPVRRCPLCSEPMSEPVRWETLVELERRGLRDLSMVEKQMKQTPALGSVSLPP